MKVLQVVNGLYTGGAEKLLVDSILKYEERGISVELLVLSGTKTPFYKDLTSKSNIRIIALSNRDSLYNPILAFRLNKYLKQYDIIHVHLFPALYWVAIANMFSYKKHNIVITEHSSNNKRRNHKLLRVIDRIIYKQFSKIITISDAVHEKLETHLHFKDKNVIQKIYNGIDLDKINNAKAYPKKELGFNETSKLILQVSSFRYPKDQGTVIKSLANLPEDVHLLLAGEGDLKQKYIDLAKALSVSNRVHFLGMRLDIPELLKTVDLIILSSHYEGLSLSSVEGLASGNPFIASDVPGLTEVVKGAGVLFPYQDVNALTELFQKLLNDEKYASQVTERSLQRAKNFSIDTMISRYINLYEAILKKTL